MRIAKILFIAVFAFGAFYAPNACVANDKVRLPKVLGGVVRSKQWIMKRNVGEEEFIGDVSYKMPGYQIFSDWALYSRKTEVIKLKGNIRGKKAWEDSSTTDASADSGRYEANERKIWLYSNPNSNVIINHNDPKYGAWSSKSKSAVYDDETSLLTLEDNVYINSKDITSKSDMARYYQLQSLLKLDGKPLIWGSYNDYDFAIQGNSATASKFYQELQIEGSVKGWIKSKTGKYE
jgi:lipopolysaccharide export system protein LptA